MKNGKSCSIMRNHLFIYYIIQPSILFIITNCNILNNFYLTFLYTKFKMKTEKLHKASYDKKYL